MDSADGLAAAVVRKRRRNDEWGRELSEWDEDELSETVGCCKQAAAIFLWVNSFLDFSTANFRIVDLYELKRENKFWVFAKLAKI